MPLDPRAIVGLERAGGVPAQQVLQVLVLARLEGDDLGHLARR
jgi:hypothetical protein